MEREIKFRAYQDGKMLTSPISSNYGLARFFGLLYEDVPIMQFINSNDSKGNPIYEDDMLGGASGVVFVVKWKDDEMRWAMQDVYTGNWFNINATILEVVGNIHENPELIVKP